MTKLQDVDVTYALLAEIEPHPENANVGNVDAIKESITHNGFYAPLIVQSTTGYILAGNHRYLAARDLKMEQVPVVYLDVDDEAAKRIMIADNRTTRLGHDDEALLLAVLEELGDSEIGLLGTGFTHAELQTLQDHHDTFDPDLLSEPDVPTGGGGKSSDWKIEAIEGAGGVCSGLLINRYDGEPLTPEDYNAVRVALGLGRAGRGAIATIGIEAWA